jgi:hypothetical protein
MLILIFIVICVIVCTLLSFLTKYEAEDDFAVGLFKLAVGVFCFVVIAAWPLVYYVNSAWISGFEAAKTTIEESNGITLEDVAIKHKMLDFNTSLAVRQYWAKTILKDFYPDEILKLEPIGKRQTKVKIRHIPTHLF